MLKEDSETVAANIYRALTGSGPGPGVGARGGRAEGVQHVAINQ